MDLSVFDYNSISRIVLSADSIAYRTQNFNAQASLEQSVEQQPR